MSKATLRVVVMAGGTGGHVFPALAVADVLRARGAEVVWLGTRQGLEASVVPRHGFALRFIKVAGLRGKGALSWVLAPLRLVRAVSQGIGVLRNVQPGVVLGMGGFASGPGGLAAWLLRRPLVIHEQNARAGLTNRLLARVATRVCEAFPGTFAARFHAVHTGNPVRAEIVALPPPAQRRLGEAAALRLLVVGGSLGASALNEAVPKALAQLATDGAVDVWHQTGARHLETTQAHYQHSAVRGRVEAFIDDMAAAYGWADLVICRAGALTVAELAAAGVGAILVPYPHAVDDHQTHNARYLVDAGAAELLPQPQLTPHALGALIEKYFSDRAALRAMAEAARGLALPDATATVAQHCVEVAGG